MEDFEQQITVADWDEVMRNNVAVPEQGVVSRLLLHLNTPQGRMHVVW